VIFIQGIYLPAKKIGVTTETEERVDDREEKKSRATE
jgi:hypothetical protein